MNSDPNFPSFISLSNTRETAFDLYSYLLTKRIIFLREELTEETANEIIAKLLFLDAEDSERDIFAKEETAYGLIDEIVSKPPV